MTNEDAIKWLENLKQDIGQLRHENLWPYAQAIDEIIDMLEGQEKRLKDPDRIKVVRCKDCRYFEPSNAEEGDNSGYCRNDYVPCQNQTVDAWWFCGSAERVSE